MPIELTPKRDAPSRQDLLRNYARIRALTEQLVAPLEPEDCVIQSMPDVSPTRWHLAHTTWFFETFVLGRTKTGHEPISAAFDHLFNSYYRTHGDPFPRSQRGLLSRPTLREVVAYRRAVDAQVTSLLDNCEDDEQLRLILELGLHHEQQHQELILTDIKHVLSVNPMHPAYVEPRGRIAARETPLRWLSFEAGLRWIGHADRTFAFDNESPHHRRWQEAFELASRPISNAEFLAFLEDDGYRRPELWLDDAWNMIQRQGWEAPLYWHRQPDGWHEFTLHGLRRLDPHEPACHLSYFEADAYARWFGARLPTEFEWEVAAERAEVAGNFVESGTLHPRPAPKGEPTDRPTQMFADVWEWTSSAYSAYPGYRPFEGTLGEYNGKFMCNQFVVRGGSCATPQTHMRRSYRSFFYPDARWQFTGVRLAR